MSAVILTGVGTGVGKTVATAALAAALAAAGRRPRVVKPVQTGLRPGEAGDLAEVTRLAGVSDVHEFARYPDPLAPATAARRCGATPPELGEVAARVRGLAGAGRPTLVEGAGGVLVRMGGWTIADLAAELAAPAVVVTGCALGALNTAELTCEALRARGVRIAGLIIGAVPARPDLAARLNLGELPEVTGAPILARIPAGAGAWRGRAFRAAAGGWFTARPREVGFPGPSA